MGRVFLHEVAAGRRFIPLLRVEGGGGLEINSVDQSKRTTFIEARDASIDFPRERDQKAVRAQGGK